MLAGLGQASVVVFIVLSFMNPNNSWAVKCVGAPRNLVDEMEGLSAASQETV